ncbi:hypothetical protein [Melittangium boletus]|uniref:Uncharacterized protein n=1 Tax=Melittangium boletus DSM 14713 TaxID=1294270 RepID=A0A250IHX4_9BACT|nr:hypothetical protein [Melittangium boletus]ATB31424.1 hypothetical protein MEBOL_004887 [Melittangium boletus DSM 14713]
MKLPSLFRRERTIIKRADAQDQVEKALAESLRVLGQVCTKVADLIETQRLERSGYSQNTLLRRLDRPAEEAKSQKK